MKSTLKCRCWSAERAVPERREEVAVVMGAKPNYLTFGETTRFDMSDFDDEATAAGQ